MTDFSFNLTYSIIVFNHFDSFGLAAQYFFCRILLLLWKQWSKNSVKIIESWSRITNLSIFAAYIYHKCSGLLKRHKFNLTLFDWIWRNPNLCAKFWEKKKTFPVLNSVKKLFLIELSKFFEFERHYTSSGSFSRYFLIRTNLNGKKHGSILTNTQSALGVTFS